MTRILKGGQALLFYMAVTILFAVTIVTLVATIEWLFGRFLW